MIKIEGTPAPKVVTVTPKKSGELAGILSAIKKEKGDKVVMAGSDIHPVERIATGMFEVDIAIGGGFPRGRYSIIYGPEGSTKTNVCYCAIATAQRMPPPCNKAVFVDLEGTFSPDWAARFGVNIDELVLVKPAFGEEAVDLIDALVRADDVAILVVDSLAVVVASKEIAQSTEKFDVGTTSILIKRLCNKMVIALSIESRRNHTPAVIFINQTRFKIGVMFGDPETMPGGQTMKFLSSLTVRVYGKNLMDKLVSTTLPAFKTVHAVVKKAKVPITKIEFDYDMCVYPHDTLKVGQTRSWGLVSNNLKQIGKLENTGKGWKLEGTVYPTLVVIQDKYENDKDFCNQLQKIVLDSHKGNMFYCKDPDELKGEEALAKGVIDLETGEIVGK
jgi:recombination protein RecA